MSWAGAQGYLGAAVTPHDSRMAGVLGGLRGILIYVTFVLVGILCAVLFNHPDFSDTARAIQDTLDTIDNTQVQDQLMAPLALKEFLPVGLMGAFAAMMFAAFVSTHDTYMHSWAGVFVQDVFLPIRQTIRGDRKPISPRMHMWVLRRGIFCVAIFIFLFSLLYEQRTDVLVFLVITGLIVSTWIGALQIGALYWKRGTTAGAWTALIVGLIGGVISWLLVQNWEWCKSWFSKAYPELWTAAIAKWPSLESAFLLSSMQLMLLFAVLCMGSYAIVSLLTGRGKTFNMDRMLHRGEYAKEADLKKEESPRRKPAWQQVLGMSKEFKADDKFIFVLCYGHIFGYAALFVVGTVLAFRFHPPETWWVGFWGVFMFAALSAATLVVAMTVIGGIRDLVRMLILLRDKARNAKDDGSVVDHELLDEVE